MIWPECLTGDDFRIYCQRDSNAFGFYTPQSGLCGACYARLDLFVLKSSAAKATVMVACPRCGAAVEHVPFRSAIKEKYDET